MSPPIDRMVCVTLSQPIMVQVPQKSYGCVMRLTQHLKGKFTHSFDGITYEEPFFVVSDFQVTERSLYWWRSDALEKGKMEDMAPVKIELDSIISVQVIKEEQV